MFGRSKQNALNPPSLASEADAREILRVWVAPEWSRLQVALLTDHSDPAIWGLALADIARHVARSYAQQGAADEATALQRIHEMFEAEWAHATDDPTGGLVE